MSNVRLPFCHFVLPAPHFIHLSLFKGLFECKGKRLINVSNFIGH